jgi:hypothetical protein
VSNKTIAATGGTPQLGKITLVDTTAQVFASVDSQYNIGKAVNYATGKRNSTNAYNDPTNSDILGSSKTVGPYGLQVSAGRGATDVIPTDKLFTMNMQAHMAAGQEYYVVLSDAVTGTGTFTTSWKKSSTLYRDGYVLRILVTPEPATLALLVLGGLPLLRRKLWA